MADSDQASDESLSESDDDNVLEDNYESDTSDLNDDTSDSNWQYHSRDKPEAVPKKSTTESLRKLFASFHPPLSIRGQVTFLQYQKSQNQLDKSVKIKDFLVGYKAFDGFYEKGTFTDQEGKPHDYYYCKDINGLLLEMGVPNQMDKWRLWLDSCKVLLHGKSTNSFKIALLHIGNVFSPVPLVYSTELDEKYEHLKHIFTVINYETHKWVISADYKVAALLCGRCGGRPTYPCIYCEKDLLTPSLDELYDPMNSDCTHLMRTSFRQPAELPENKRKRAYAIKKNKSIENDTIISDPFKILFAPLHVRLGLWEQLYKKLSSEARDYLGRKKLGNAYVPGTAVVYNGPDIKRICKDDFFQDNILERRNEKPAFKAFRDVSYYVLSSQTHPTMSKQALVTEMFRCFHLLGCNFPLKLHLLFSHLNMVPDNVDDFSDQHGERFHQQFKKVEDDFKAAPKENMLGQWCCQAIALNPPYESV